MHRDALDRLAVILVEQETVDGDLVGGVLRDERQARPDLNAADITV